MIAVQVAGQLDFSSVSGLVFLQASVEGSDLILLASSNDSQPMKLMVHSGITGPERSPRQDRGGYTLRFSLPICCFVRCSKIGDWNRKRM